MRTAVGPGSEGCCNDDTGLTHVQHLEWYLARGGTFAYNKLVVVTTIRLLLIFLTEVYFINSKVYPFLCIFENAYSCKTTNYSPGIKHSHLPKYHCSSSKSLAPWASAKLGEEVLTLLSLPQDYRWWWRNFLVSGGSAFYVLVYAIFYFVNKVLPLFC